MYSILVLLIFLSYAIIVVRNFIVFQKKVNEEKLLSIDDKDFKNKKKVIRKKYLINHFLLILPKQFVRTHHLKTNYSTYSILQNLLNLHYLL